MKGVLKAFLILFLAVFNAGMVWSGVFLFQNAYYELGIVLLTLLVLIDFFIFNPKAYPYRYTIPALILLFILVLYPIYFTVKIAFTNYGTGHLMTKQEAVERLLFDPNFTYVPKGVQPIPYRVFAVFDGLKPTEDFLILFEIDGALYLSEKPVVTKKSGKEVLLRESTLHRIEDGTVQLDSKTYEIVPWPSYFENIDAITANGKTYKLLYSPDDASLKRYEPFFKVNIAQKYLNRAELWYGDQTLMMRISESGKWYFYPVKRLYSLSLEESFENGKVTTKLVVKNNLTGRNLVEREGAFYDYDENGRETFVVGYMDYIGLKNFARIFTDPKISGPFFKVFVWTFTWAALSVLFTFAIGLSLALVLNDKSLLGKNVYRTLLIIPWAVPAFISVLVWRNGMFNETYGILNRFVLPLLGLDPIKWFNDPFWAKVAVLTVNTWLGFPYMMAVSLGALQSIPEELYEAAAIDGAGKWRRFWTITFPLLMTTVAPLLVGSFAFNFNNFVNIYLLTGGGPAMAGATTPVGHTDILISYVYKLAFEGGRGQDFGFASAISIIIFFLVGGISFVNFKLSGSFEEVSE
ncbi:DUF4896 domain-containing protein [Thermotoga sp. KOL6]|uniref:DUF4896 domain-containing protein n=1 Tax=Thermotoga sp. KOL6 TaxID=126741 RepID=UPI000C76A02C|nr:DUF4896 domain-containing protein [Thermotoga sp. KOL6]PLV60449.1 maltose ABC transporter permease [Thermotoga sp. KOL6]